MTDTPRARKRTPLLPGLLVLSLLTAGALFAPLLAPSPPAAQSLENGLAAPALDHPLGRDRLGRDQLSRVLYGARVSLGIGLGTVTLSLVLGVLLGCAAGYLGGPVDFLIMRLVDVLLAFPGLLLAIALAAVLGPGAGNVVLALGLTAWTSYARLARGEVLSLRRREHVLAAEAMGLGPARVVTRHLLPLLAAPLLVQASFGVAGAIVAESSLSFLGLGVQAPSPSWGSMLNDGRSFLLVAPHLTIFPGLAILFTVLGLNSLGDALRDRLDVRFPG
ncbi:MAG TPA: ABC transporter permease [Deltaproteobacteria bacterium]|nr:ABC transporter permease [Candidatus Binatota bacterium]HIL12229.1 ABC transporter permease [Deltaproteobacteria bacterium]